MREGKEVLPANFIVRFPVHSKGELEKRIAQIPSHRMKEAERRLRAKHRVSHYRQTLHSIAEVYDVAVHRLAKGMGLEPNSRLSKGKVVLVYSKDSQFSELPKPLSFGE